MNGKCKRIIFAVLIVIFSANLPLTAIGNGTPEQLLDPEEVEVFLDSFIPGQMKDDTIPGMVFVLVKEGKIFLKKGYGVSDLHSKTKMNPDETLVYIASATKPFTAAAVMQLVSIGKLDLHRDINTYLKGFKVDNNFPQSLTLTHLLTHTAGFDDKNIGYVARHPSGKFGLQEYLAGCLPPRIMPPGLVSSYSNHGYGLAGYLVEVASGLSYSQYLEDYIFNPLAMTRSQAYLNLTPEKLKYLAVGYEFDYRTRTLVPSHLGYRNIAPAGSITTTAGNMANFMVALLQKGRFNGNELLTQAGQAKMFSQQFTHHPGLPGFTYGFYEIYKNGLRILTHAGGFTGYSCQIFLFPSQQIGIFAAANRMKLGIYQDLLDKFVNRYLPGHGVVTLQRKNTMQKRAKEDLNRFNGMYQYTRYSRTSIEKIAIWDTQVRIESGGDNFVLVYPPRGHPVKWIQVKSLLFRHEKKSDFMAFKEDNKSRITHMFFSLAGSGLPAAFEKLSWRSDVRVQRVILTVLLVIFLMVLTGWPVVWLIKRIFQRKRESVFKGGLLVTFMVWLNSLLAVIFIVGLDSLIGNSLYRLKLVWGMTGEMKILLWIPFLIICLTIMTGYFVYKIWRKRSHSLAGSLLYTLVFIANTTLIVFMINWNLLGFNY